MQPVNFYKRFGYFNHFIRKLRMQTVLQWIEGNSVFDVGCEFGILSTMLPEETSYVGIDDDLSAIDIAREFETENKRFFHMSIGEAPLDFGRFDNIVLCAVIEHMENAEGILKNLKRNLTDDGRVIITTPTPRSDKILKYGSKIGLFHEESIDEHCHYFDKGKLHSIMDELGLETIHHSTFELGLNGVICGKNGQ